MKGYVDDAEPAGPTGAAHRLAGFPPYVLAYVKADLDAPRLRDIPLQLARKIAAHPSLLRP